MDIDGEANAADAEALWRQRSAPENQAPVSVAFDAVLVRTEDAAVFVSGLQVYRNGVAFTLEIRTRTVLLGPGGAGSVLHDHGPNAVLVGVELADGRRCVHGRHGMSDAAGPALNSYRGGGSSRRAELNLFLSPLPPAGVNTLLCAWPWLGISDRSTLLPTEDIHRAAANVIELWPWEPEVERPDRDRTPDIPADSWFAPAN